MINSKRESILLTYINETPVIQSLLYDCDLMPEQLKRETRDWDRMLYIADHWRAREKTETSSTTPVSAAPQMEMTIEDELWNEVERGLKAAYHIEGYYTRCFNSLRGIIKSNAAGQEQDTAVRQPASPVSARPDPVPAAPYDDTTIKARDYLFAAPASDTPCTHSFDDIENAWAEGLCAYCLKRSLNAERRGREDTEYKLTHSSICEIAASNQGILEYCDHWEKRAERAEADRKLQERALRRCYATLQPLPRETPCTPEENFVRWVKEMGQ